MQQVPLMSQTTTFALLRMAGTGTMRQLWRKLFLLGAFAASLAVACTMLERGLSAAGAMKPAESTATAHSSDSIAADISALCSSSMRADTSVKSACLRSRRVMKRLFACVSKRFTLARPFANATLAHAPHANVSIAQGLETGALVVGTKGCASALKVDEALDSACAATACAMAAMRAAAVSFSSTATTSSLATLAVVQLLDCSALEPVFSHLHLLLSAGESLGLSRLTSSTAGTDGGSATCVAAPLRFPEADSQSCVNSNGLR
mmetsp:Transcript_2024/g.5181  ORF Transcript_2024/g.5181 Transcript_2024/m.5181 type:complete len:263 (-) Transcript_2024:728-1516(-)